MIPASYALRFRLLLVLGVVLTVGIIKRTWYYGTTATTPPKCPNVAIDQMSEPCFIELFTMQRQERTNVIERELLQRERDNTTCDTFNRIIADVNTTFFRSFVEYNERTKNWTRATVIDQMPSSDGVVMTSEDEMDNRKKLMQRGCAAFDQYWKIKKMNAQSQITRELLALQSRITNITTTTTHQPYTQFRLPSTQIDKNFRSMFFIDHKHIGPLCLPPKTGTTNWQRALTALILNTDSDTLLDPASIYDQAAFSALPRYYSKYNGLLFPQYGRTMGECIRDKLLERSQSVDSISWIITRHPFARLYSAWNQKFKNEYNGLAVYKAGYERADFNETQAGHQVSFGAFLDYIVDFGEKNGLDKLNPHWKSSWTSCFPCSFKFKYVAKQESSGADAAFLFDKMSVNRLTYLPGMYSNGIVKLHDSWQHSSSTVDLYRAARIERRTLERLYTLYFMDFVLYNYTTDGFLYED